MKRYSEILGVNTVFQNSVNIGFDLNSEEKIMEYIPTRDACGILDGYIKTVLGKKLAETESFSGGCGHSTILLGPYGKGKSFLVLVLLFILSCDDKNAVYQCLLERIGKVDMQLAADIKELKEKNLRLLPVVINSDYDNLTQAFTVAINDALRQNEMSNLVPQNAFDVCLDVIKGWEQADDSYLAKVVAPCAKKNGIDYQQMKDGLIANHKKSYEDFTVLYNCVIRGLPFNPLVKNDIVGNIKCIASAVSEFGYSGLFFVFDEFSKFIEGREENLGGELNLLQTIFEAANGSKKDSQIHLCCITHKPLASYAKGSSIGVNAFRTVEGRVKEIRFTRSIGENTQLLAYAIKKKEGFDKFWSEYHDTHEVFYDALKKANLIPEENNLDLIKGCFPLNPISVKAVIALSEMVAQNERTLFTFVSDNDRYSVNTFIHNHSDGLLNLPWIYDYFASSFEKESDKVIKSIWYRCESCLKHVSLEIEREVLKAIAIFEMVKDDSLLPNDENLALACCLSSDRVGEVLTQLVGSSLIRRNAFNNLYMFASANSGEVDSLVSRYVMMNQKSLRIRDILPQLAEMKYCVSREYNAKYKMTRFLKVAYIPDCEFARLASFDSLVSDSLADGVLIRVIKTAGFHLSNDEHSKKSGAHKVIVQYSSGVIEEDIKVAILRYAALSALCKKCQDETVCEEMKMQIAELTQDLNGWIARNFNKSQTYVKNTQYDSLQEAITSTFQSVYSKTPIINNELINKQEISAQYAKARNNVIGRILNHQDMKGFSETSPEMTVFNAIYLPKDSTARESIIGATEAIREYLKEGSEEKVKSFDDVIKQFTSEPFGIRRGVMPLLLADAISKITDHLVFYYENKEIVLNANHLEAISGKGKNYKYALKKGSHAQEQFVLDLADYFHIPQGSFYAMISEIAENCRSFCVNLPNVVRESNRSRNSGIALSTNSKSYLDSFLCFAVNPYEVLFESLPHSFGCCSGEEIDFDRYRGELIAVRTELSDSLSKYKSKICSELCHVFDPCVDSNLSSVFSAWLAGLDADVEQIKSLYGSSLFNSMKTVVIESLSLYDDSTVVDKLSKVVNNWFVAEWNVDKTAELTEKVKEFKKELEQQLQSADSHSQTDDIPADNVELSIMGKRLKKMLLMQMDSFGESLSNEEKVTILKSLLWEVKK